MKFTVNMLLTCSIYSGIPISRTSRETQIVREIGGKIRVFD